jgi:hypothetical protein
VKVVLREVDKPKKVRRTTNFATKIEIIKEFKEDSTPKTYAWP